MHAKTIVHPESLLLLLDLEELCVGYHIDCIARFGGTSHSIDQVKYKNAIFWINDQQKIKIQCQSTHG